MNAVSYNALPPVVEVNPSDAGLAFFVYALVLDLALNRYALTLNKTVYTGGGLEHEEVNFTRC